MKTWLLFYLGAGCMTGVAGLAEQAGPMPSEGDRYLFAVDTSLAMAPLKETLRNTVYDMIYSGLGGQTKRGDSMGVWAFNEQSYPQPFPPLDWSLERREHLATQAYEFLKARRFEKRSQPDVLFKDLTPLIKGSRKLTVFLLSNGAQPIQGTPFDGLVNAVYRERGATLRQAGKPVITVLTASEGQITAWTVTTIGEPFDLRLLVSAAADQTSLGRTNTTSARTAGNTASSEAGPKNEIPIPPARMVVVQPVKIASEPIIPAPLAASPRDTPLVGMGRSELAADKPTLESAGELRSPPISPPSEPAKAVPLPATANSSEPPSRVDVRSGSAPQATRPEDSSEAPAPPIAVAPTGLPTAAQLTAAPMQWGFLCIGAGLALAAITLVILLIRLNRRTCQPSYISQSIGRERG